MKNENFNQELKKLEQFDTPSITNVVATYPEDQELCLGLYDPWAANWYTDQSVKCMYPELGRRAGYAVTVVYGPVDANFKRRSFDDVLRAIDASPKPVIVCIKQDFPEEIKNKNGLCGGNMTIMCLHDRFADRESDSDALMSVGGIRGILAFKNKRQLRFIQSDPIVADSKSNRVWIFYDDQIRRFFTFGMYIRIFQKVDQNLFDQCGV